MGTTYLCWVRPGAIRHGRARQSSGTGFGISRNQGYKTRGIAIWLKVVLIPRVANTGVKVLVRDLVRIVGIVDPFAPRGVGTRGQFVSSSPRRLMCTGDLCRVPPAAVRHGRARQSSGTGPCGHCRRVLWVPGPRGQYSEILFYQENWSTRQGGRHTAKRNVKVQVRDLVIVDHGSFHCHWR